MLPFKTSGHPAAGVTPVSMITVALSYVIDPGQCKMKDIRKDLENRNRDVAQLGYRVFQFSI